MNGFKKIVLTGGPCGGKTQGVTYLKNKLEGIGLNVIVVSEAAEILIKDGFNRENSFSFQKAIALKQLKSESDAESKSNNNTVVICDRGLMDAKVYLSDGEFDKLKNEICLSDVEMRDRYDAVFHMDSVEDKNRYIKSDVRIEQADFAAVLNNKSLHAWCGNPHYRFIPVCDTLMEKLDILFKEVCSFIGIPEPFEIERKFLIKKPDIETLLNKCCQKVNIKQYYLNDGVNNFRIRSRGIDSDLIYVKTQKNKINDLVYEEIEDRISREEFKNYLATCMVEGLISKDRYCLMYNGIYYEIDIFPFWGKQAYLEVKLLNENQLVQIPNFIQVIEDVTFKPEYKNKSLSKNIPEEKI